MLYYKILGTIKNYQGIILGRALKLLHCDAMYPV